MTTVTMADVRKVGQEMRTDGKTFCASGIRTWCRTHGIDYLTLHRDGIDAAVMRGTDSWGARAAEIAEARNGR